MTCYKFTSIFIILLNSINALIADQSLQCGDWNIYKEEKCFKVLDNKDVQNFEDAKRVCYQNEASSLVSIRSQEEQDFLYNLLLNVHKSKNDVWIGAQFKDKNIKWSENITVNYTNWANGYPRSDSGYECVLMEMVGQTAGKWLNEPCERNHAVVCEKHQNFLLSYLENLQKTVNELRLSNENLILNLKTTKQELDNSRNEMNKTITELLEINKIRFENIDNELEDSKNIFQTLSSRLDATNHELINTEIELEINKNGLKSTLNELNLTKNELNNTKINLEISKLKLDNTVKELNSTKIELDKTKIEMTKTNAEIQSTKTEIQSNKKDLDINKNKLDNTVIELKSLMEKSSEFSPTGTIAYFSKTSPPKGWLKANGQSVSRITYANLFATIGTIYGSGDGSSTFNLPDLRGEFIRGWSDGRDVDSNRIFGSFQWGSSIPYPYSLDISVILGLISSGRNFVPSPSNNGDKSFAGSTYDGGFKDSFTSNQTQYGMTFNSYNVQYVETTKTSKITSWSILQGTRPRNIALLTCIKY